MDRLRNEQTRSYISVNSLLREIEDNKLRWYGHTKLMDDARLKKYILNGSCKAEEYQWESSEEDG